MSHLDDLTHTAESAARDPDPWRGLARFLELTCETVAGNRGFATAMTELQYGATPFEEHRAKLLLAVEVLLQRSKAAGAVRPEVELGEFALGIGFVRGALRHLVEED